MHQARAIVWAQFRTLLNFYSRGNTGSLVFAVIATVIWYGMVAAGAVSVAIVVADPRRLELVNTLAPKAFLFMFGYWQVMPILLTSTGASLDLKRLMAYPVTQRGLFGLEVLLRFSTGIEMVMMLIAIAAGILLNPHLRSWGLVAFLPWTAFNLFLAAGLRDLLTRLLARRGVREAAVLALVLLTALPQVILFSGIPAPVRKLVERLDVPMWPWQVTARLAVGEGDWRTVAILLCWTAAALVFGRFQFERGLRFDAEAARSTPATSIPSSGWLERWYRLPSALFPDPLGAIVEKEIRFLSRAPRFRIVFLMGFSFGLLIWLPLAFRGAGSPDGFFASNYLTFVAVYALMLLGEVSFWNSFGFDRSAAQAYWVMPVSLSKVLLAKNIAALVFVFLEVTAIAVVCAAMRMPVTPAKLFESYLVTLIFTIFLLAVGNLGSTYFPRPVNPTQSWRSASAGRFQAILMLAYPVLAIPIILAYLARFAFESELAFYGVLAFGALLGCVVYWVSMESAVDAAEKRKESILNALAQGEGPVSA